MLGIDVSQEQLACALFDRPSERFLWERPVPNTPAGVRTLLRATPPEVPWVLEPTGRYGLTAVRLAREAGRTVLLAPPRKAKAYLQSLGTQAKTDRLDARGLALFAATRTKAEALRPYPLKTEDVERLDQLLVARQGIVTALASLKQRIVELPHAAPVLQEAVADLQARRAKLDEQIAALTGKDGVFPAAAKLRKVPGVGPVIAAAAASRLSSRAFEDGDSFVAYIGLDVGVIRSGKRAGERGLTKQGDADLRRLFYLAAASNVRSRTSPFRKQYERELAKGLSKTAALNAVARKIARVCWSLVKHDTDYDPLRVHAPAPRNPQPKDPTPEKSA